MSVGGGTEERGGHRRKGGRKRGRKEGREGGREEERKEGREGGREGRERRKFISTNICGAQDQILLSVIWSRLYLCLLTPSESCGEREP